MKQEAAVVGVVGLAVVSTTVMLTGPFGLLLLPVLLSHLAEVVWGPNPIPSPLTSAECAPTGADAKQPTTGAKLHPVYTDVELVRAAARDDSAFEELVRTHGQRLRSLCTRLARTLDWDEDDLVQEVWLNIFRRLSRLQDARLFRAWSSRIAVNVAISRQRWLAIRPQEPRAEMPEVDHPLSTGHEESVVLYYALEQLPEEEATILILRAGHRLKWAEVASVMTANFSGRWNERRCAEVYAAGISRLRRNFGAEEEQR